MNPTVYICFVAALVVSTSAIPHYREIDEKSFEYEPENDLDKHLSNEIVDINDEEIQDALQNRKSNDNESENELEKHLSNEIVDVDDEEIKDALQNGKNLGWWWDHKGVHNLTIGYKTYQDSLLQQKTIFKPYKTLRVVEEDVKISNSSPFVITLVEAYDQHPDQSSAGYVRITSGGVGNKNVTLHLTSSRGHGLKYIIRVWGHRVY